MHVDNGGKKGTKLFAMNEEKLKTDRLWVC